MNWKAFLMSRKTTITGICLIAGTVMTTVALLLDGDPTTNPDWVAVGGAIVAGVGFIFTRDADKSSQDSGIRK